MLNLIKAKEGKHGIKCKDGEVQKEAHKMLPFFNA
jgi:hypothetical protein